MMAKLTDRAKGLLIILTGVLILSPEAVLTRFLSEGGAGAWTIVFWKMLFAIPITVGFPVYNAGGFAKLGRQIVDARIHYPAAVLFHAAASAGVTLSFVYTSAANALLLINLNPLWCALAGMFLLGDKLQEQTCAALVVALGCMLIIFFPELVQRSATDAEGEEEEKELGDSTPLGDVFALLAGIGIAGVITISRHGAMREKPVNLVGHTGFVAMLTTMVALAVQKGDVLPSSYWRVDEEETKMWQFWLASFAQGISIGVIQICTTLAPMFITGAETGLVRLVEVILGPLFVFLAYGDVPSKWTITGGSLLLVVLALHEATPLFSKTHQSISRSISRRFSKQLDLEAQGEDTEFNTSETDLSDDQEST